MSVIDVFTYNGEEDLLEIRLNILNDYVDQFIIVEFDQTFSGKTKPIYFVNQSKRFDKWKDKIKYVLFTEKDWNRYMYMALTSLNTIGADHWKREFCQKECIKDAITHLNDNDMIFIGDVDEIWNPQHFYITDDLPYKIELLVYTYYLNNRSTEKFWGTLLGNYKDIKNECLNHLRSDSPRELSGPTGWHFTSMGGYEKVKQKLEDSYTSDSYANDTVMRNLKKNVEQSNDFLGRGFIYTIDESELPQYLLDNKEKYEHLWRKQ